VPRDPSDRVKIEGMGKKPATPRHFPRALKQLERIAEELGARFTTGAPKALAHELAAILTVSARSVDAAARKRARSWWDALDRSGAEWKPAFLAAIRRDKSPTDADLATMTLLGQLELAKTTDAKGERRRAQVTSVAPLRALALLEKLDVNCFGGVTDWPVLAELPRLRELAIHFALYDAAPLAKLVELRALDLGENAVPNVTALRTLAKLERLGLASNKVTSLAGIDAMRSLRWLHVDFNDELADLTPLASHPRLEVFACSYTKVADLRPLRGLPALRTINLRYTDVRDLTPLAGCTALETVSCTATRQTRGLMALASLPRLTKLVLGVEARPSDVAELRKRRPDVDVR